jgi:hypothetical protein
VADFYVPKAVVATTDICAGKPTSADFRNPEIINIHSKAIVTATTRNELSIVLVSF